MITIQHGTTRYTVTEAHAARYRAMIDSGKLPKIKSPQSTPIKRAYPEFFPGMATASYLQAYANLNDRVSLTRIEYDHADRAAPMLDPRWPEVVEEVDLDYVAPPPVKKKTSRAATIERLLREVLGYIDAGEPPSPSGDWATETREALK